MKIQLTSDQRDALLAWSAQRTVSELSVGCEPSGYTLEIEVQPPLPPSAKAVSGAAQLDLGDVQIEI